MKHDVIETPIHIGSSWVEEVSANKVLSKGSVTFDLSRSRSIDSAGIAFLRTLGEDGAVSLQNVSNDIHKSLKRAESVPKTTEGNSHSEKSLRKKIAELKSAAIESFSILVEMIWWGTVGLLERRDFRKGVLGEQMFLLGYRAIGIISALTFLIGVALAAQSIIQLRLFGADSFLMAMIVMGMVRELGPLMVAIVLAGRTGSAITAEIATMSVQEEVDALKTMGLNHIQHIVVPKFWAVTLTIPFLSTLGTFMGILGGAAIALTMGGQSLHLVFNEFQKALIFKDFVISIIKSFVFGWLVVWIGSYYGYKVKGGAEEVGKETTNSVVAAIFTIVIVDALFSFVYEMF